MRIIISGDFEEWRTTARRLVYEKILPGAIEWALGDPAPELPLELNDSVRVPREFVDTARLAAHGVAADKWDTFYRVLWRISQGEKDLLSNSVDPDVVHFELMAKSVMREVHRLESNLIFETVGAPGREREVAWSDSDLPVLNLVVPKIQKKMSSGQRWSILSTKESVHWDGKKIRSGPGLPKELSPPSDAISDLWKAYRLASAKSPAHLITVRSQTVSRSSNVE